MNSPVRETTADELNCRWPDCGCYSPQGPGECRRLKVSPLAERWAYLDKVDAERRAPHTEDR